jgi:tRNA nucleotidyltransferase (CCA-adding enzyme)
MTRIVAGGERRFEHFEHGADIGVRGHGTTMAEAFEAAALAAIAVITPPEQVRREKSIALDVTGADPELLLINFLNAIIFEMAAERMIFGRFELRIDGLHLTGTATGETIDRARHEPAVEIKGATLTLAKVAEVSPGDWIAQCVVDV